MTDIYNTDGNLPTNETVVTPPAAIQLPDTVVALVGEGKKYATIEKALEALPHAQAFIEQLKTENDKLREEVTKGVAVGEVYETVQELLAKNGKPPVAAPVSDADIEGVLDRKLQEREAQRIAAENVKTFKDAMQKKFGEKEKEQWQAKAKELGVSEVFLSDVVKKSPAAALTLFGLTPGPQGAPKPTTGNVNTAALQAQPHQQQARKSVMFGAKNSDLLEAWRAAAPKSD